MLPSGLVVTVGVATVAAPEPATTTLLFNFALASVDKSATTLLPEAVVVMYLPLSAPTTPKLKPPFWFNFCVPVAPELPVNLTVLLKPSLTFFNWSSVAARPDTTVGLIISQSLFCKPVT